MPWHAGSASYNLYQFKIHLTSQVLDTFFCIILITFSSSGRSTGIANILICANAMLAAHSMCAICHPDSLWQKRGSGQGSATCVCIWPKSTGIPWLCLFFCWVFMLFMHVRACLIKNPLKLSQSLSAEHLSNWQQPLSDCAALALNLDGRSALCATGWGKYWRTRAEFELLSVWWVMLA